MRKDEEKEDVAGVVVVVASYSNPPGEVKVVDKTADCRFTQQHRKVISS